MDDLTTVIAIYGAVLSTIVAILTAYNYYRHWKREKVQIKVEFSMRGWEKNHPQLCVIARNSGQLTNLDYFEIKEVSEIDNPFYIPLIRENKKMNFYSALSPTFHYKIETGNELSYRGHYTKEIDAEELFAIFGKSKNKKIIAVFVDQIGDRWESEPWKFDRLLFYASALRH
jgi:hypothetical protein